MCPAIFDTATISCLSETQVYSPALSDKQQDGDFVDVGTIPVFSIFYLDSPRWMCSKPDLFRGTFVYIICSFQKSVRKWTRQS